MSTKIYNAFILDESVKTLDDLTKFNLDLRKQLEADALVRIADTMARDVFRIKDLYAYYGDKIFHRRKNKIKNRHMLDMLKYVAEEKRYQKGVDAILWVKAKDVYDDLVKELKEYIVSNEVQVVYFACGDRILCMVFGDQTYFDYFYNHPLMKDFHYQNQCDPPEDVPEDEYEKRGEIWEKVIGPDYIPAKHGFEFKLLDGQDICFEVELIQNEDNRKRALKIAEEDYEYRTKTIRETINCPLYKSGMSCSEWAKITRTEEYKKWEKKVNKQIRSKMGWPEEPDETKEET